VQDNSAEKVAVEAAAKVAIPAAEVQSVKRTVSTSVAIMMKTLTIVEVTSNVVKRQQWRNGKTRRFKILWLFHLWVAKSWQS
jgi:hypothetical protein